MSDFLTRLSRTALGEASGVRPVVAPLFASGPRLAGEPLDIAVSEESVAAPPPSPRRAGDAAGDAAVAPRRAHDDFRPAQPSRLRDARSMAPRDAPLSSPRDSRRDGGDAAAEGAGRRAAASGEPATPAQPRDAGAPRVERHVVHEATTRERHVVHAVDVRREPARAEPGDRGALSQRAEPRAVARQPEVRPPAQPAPVEVRIGRIEVRVGDALPAPQPRPPASPGAGTPKLGLDEYLRSRDGAAR